MEKGTKKAPQEKQITELNETVGVLLDSKNKESKECLQALQNIFDLILWAEKRNPKVLEATLQSELLSFLLQEYASRIHTLLSGMTMLLGNAKENGVLSKHIIQNRLGDRILRLYLSLLTKEEHIEQQQHLHTLGSLLKAYHRHLTQNTYLLFIEDGRCLLIEICCKFFNCPEQITRTSVMNILMSLLKLPFIEKILQVKSIKQRIELWCQDMCRLFRNELKDFDQHLLITDQTQSQFIINSINDKIILWEDLSVLTPHLFASHFYSQIVVPLVVGSLNTTGIPLFTLKFALFLLNKLIPTIAKLDLLPKLGTLLFEAQDVLYEDQQLGTAILRPFSLKNLLKVGIPSEQEEEEEEPNVFKNLNQFFLNILRSKDGRFLQCACIFLVNLVSAVKQSPSASLVFIQKLGFGPGGSTVTQMTNIIINHFTATHSLQITRIIAALLNYIQPEKCLDDQLKNRFIHVYRGLVQETLYTLNKHPQLHPFIAQLLQYDIKALFSPIFSLQPVAKTDSALLFNNHLIQNDSLPFYSQIPQTSDSIARYQIVKVLLLRELSRQVVEECQKQISAESYYNQIRGKYLNKLKPGQFIKLPIKINSYRCKLQDGKIVIPNCLLLQDEESLIIGYLQDKSIRIIINFKFKHVKAVIDHHKKQKIYVHIGLRRYSSQHQNLQDTKGLLLRQLDVHQDYFVIKRNKIILQEINMITDLLKKSKKILPEFSLI